MKALNLKKAIDICVKNEVKLIKHLEKDGLLKEERIGDVFLEEYGEHRKAYFVEYFTKRYLLHLKYLSMKRPKQEGIDDLINNLTPEHKVLYKKLKRTDLPKITVHK